MAVRRKQPLALGIKPSNPNRVSDCIATLVYPSLSDRHCVSPLPLDNDLFPKGKDGPKDGPTVTNPSRESTPGLKRRTAQIVQNRIYFLQNDEDENTDGDDGDKAFAHLPGYRNSFLRSPNKNGRGSTEVLPPIRRDCSFDNCSDDVADKKSDITSFSNQFGKTLLRHTNSKKTLLRATQSCTNFSTHTSSLEKLNRVHSNNLTQNLSAQNGAQQYRIKRIERSYQRHKRFNENETNQGVDVDLSHDLQKECDGANGLITQIFRTHQTFDPQAKFGGQDDNKRKGSKEEPDRDYDDGLVGRLEAYKYHRKIRKEVVPIPMDVVLEAIKEEKAKQKPFPAFDLTNYHPARKKEIFLEWCETNGIHRQEVRARAWQYFRERVSKHREFLERLDCGGVVISDGVPTKTETRRRKMEWMKHFNAIFFIEACFISHKVSTIKCDDVEKELDLIQSKERIFNYVTPCLQERFRRVYLRGLLFRSTPDTVKGKLKETLCAMIMTKIQILRRRRDATKLHETMVKWAHYGRPLVIFKRYYVKMRRLQNFWKASFIRLEATYDKVEKIWMKAERKVLTKELQDPTRRRSMTRQKQLDLSKSGYEQPKLSLDERIELAEINPIRRKKYIRHEMTATRYRMLPRVYEWEDQYKIYWEKVKEWREAREGAQTMHVKFDREYILPPPCLKQMPLKDQIKKWFHAAKKDPTKLRPIKPQMGREKEDEYEEHVNDEFAFLNEGAIQLAMSEADLEMERRVMYLPL